MRIRQIKPQIMSNEEIVELGPYAYILFTGLWMVSDREGRFEWRPRRIKALVMPLWEDVDAQAVEDLLEKLCESGLLHSYEVDGKRYGAVVNWSKHQNPDPREAPSKIPPPSGFPGVSATDSATCQLPLELHRQHTVNAVSSRVGNGYMGNGNRESIGVQGECEGETSTTPSPKPKPPIPPPPPGACEQPEEPPPIPAEPKRPERVRSAHGMRHASAVLHPRARGEAPPRKGPGVVDWWPHSAEDVAAVRASLRALGELHRLPPPDDAIVLRVLDAARGSNGGDIHRLLRWLHRREKFREIRSWGLLPVVIGQHCSMAGSA